MGSSRTCLPGVPILLLALLLLLLPAGCGGGVDAEIRGAVEALSAAAAAGDDAKARTLMAKEMLEELGVAPGESPCPAARRLLVPVPRVRGIRHLMEGFAEADLEEGGRTGEAKVVLAGGAWRVRKVVWKERGK